MLYNQKPFMSQETLRIIYFSYVHSIWFYGVIFCVNSSYCDSIFKVQKRIIRVIMNSRNRDSCHTLFMKLNILQLQSQYTLSMLLLQSRVEKYVIEILIFIVSIPDTVLIYTLLCQNQLYFKREPVVLELRFLIIFHQP